MKHARIENGIEKKCEKKRELSNTHEIHLLTFKNNSEAKLANCSPDGENRSTA
jgi:hypothetical protein